MDVRGGPTRLPGGRSDRGGVGGGPRPWDKFLRLAYDAHASDLFDLVPADHLDQLRSKPFFESLLMDRSDAGADVR